MCTAVIELKQNFFYHATLLAFPNKVPPVPTDMVLQVGEMLESNLRLTVHGPPYIPLSHCHRNVDAEISQDAESRATLHPQLTCVEDDLLCVHHPLPVTNGTLLKHPGFNKATPHLTLKTFGML